MTDDAPFAQRLVLEDDRLALLPMAGGAVLVQAGNGQPRRGLKDIAPVRIVALHAIHAILEDRVMMRQVKFRVRREVALEATGRIAARVDNKLAPPAPGGDMFAGRPVARFTSGRSFQLRHVNVDAGVRAAGEMSRDRSMAIGANLVADVFGPGDLWRADDRPMERRTGDDRARGQQQKAGPARPKPKARPGIR